MTHATIRTIAPVVDAVLVPLLNDLYHLKHTRAVMVRNAEKCGALDSIAKELARIDAEMAAKRIEAAPLKAIAVAGKWERFIYVPGGHVHRYYCGTVRITTARATVIELSGATEAEVVEAAGEEACTVCFPDAPVTNRPSTLAMSVADRAAREAQQNERSAKRVTAAANALTDENGKTVYKTRRAAENDLGKHIDTLVYYGIYRAVLTYWDGTTAPNTETHEEFDARREDNLYAPERANVRRVLAIMEHNGYTPDEITAVVTKKWDKAVKENAKDGGALSTGFTY